MKIYRTYHPDRDIVLYNGDCLKLLKKLPDNSVALTVTSPPYCMGKEYESSTSYEDFSEIHKKILPEIVRVTKPGGSICWQVGYHVSNGTVMPLDYLVHRIAENIDDLYLRNRIIWTYGHGLHCKKRFSGRHETILWYTKGIDYTFNLDAVRIPQKYPGKTHYKGANKGLPSGNPKGKNPGDIWDIPNVKANHIEKTDHPCQFPIALAQRLILALSTEGDLVFDPFMGVGSTGCAAITEQRRFVGAEVHTSYYNTAVNRCDLAFQKKLNFRPHNKPVYIPDPNSKVARNPFEVETTPPV